MATTNLLWFSKTAAAFAMGAVATDNGALQSGFKLPDFSTESAMEFYVPIASVLVFAVPGKISFGMGALGLTASSGWKLWKRPASRDFNTKNVITTYIPLAAGLLCLVIIAR